MSVTIYDDVTAGIRPAVPDSDKDYVEGKIEEAEAELESRLGDLDAWINASEDADDVAKRKRNLTIVVKRMLARVLTNPNSLDSETAGDYSYTRNRSVASGQIYASKADWRLLGIAGRMAAGTIHSHLSTNSPMYPRTQTKGRW